MPTRFESIFSYLEEMSHEFKDKYNYDNLSSAFGHVILKMLFGLSDDEIYDLNTDGFNDNGIDAIYFEDAEEKVVHFFQFKFPSSVSSMTNGISQSDVQTIFNGFDSFTGNDEKFNLLEWNEILKEKRIEYEKNDVYKFKIWIIKYSSSTINEKINNLVSKQKTDYENITGNSLEVDIMTASKIALLYENNIRDKWCDFKLKYKVIDGKLYVEQGIIAGCAGGGFENICAAADILTNASIGPDEFTLSVYPASMPIYMELIKNGCAATLLETGAVLKTAFCGPCFGAGDTPANNAFSIRHSTRNFPNREGSKLQNGQIASVALMDARSIAATAANKGVLTPATDFDGTIGKYKYHFDSNIYANRVFDSKGVADPGVEIHFGPNIKDWPEMTALPENLVLRVVSEIHDPVTTTDELIPSGETSSYRSNPLGLAEFTLSRKDPAYVGLAKDIQVAQKALMEGKCAAEAKPELKPVIEMIKKSYPDVNHSNIGFGSTIFAVKPGDGSAREQAASCQKVLGGWANIANEYATKRYRSNLINWGMLPFLIEEGELPFKNLDYLFFPGIRTAVETKADTIKAYKVAEDGLHEFTLRLGELTDEERQIILKGCLINYNRI